MHNGARKNRVSARSILTTDAKDLPMAPEAPPPVVAKKSAPKKRKQRDPGDTQKPVAKKPTKDKKYPNQPAVIKKKAT